MQPKANVAKHDKDGEIRNLEKFVNLLSAANKAV
jgi:hypothetical protein